MLFHVLSMTLMLNTRVSALIAQKFIDNIGTTNGVNQEREKECFKKQLLTQHHQASKWQCQARDQVCCFVSMCPEDAKHCK